MSLAPARQPYAVLSLPPVSRRLREAKAFATRGWACMILKPVVLATMLYTSQHTDKMVFQPGQTDDNQKWHSRASWCCLPKRIQETHAFEHEEHGVPVPGLPSPVCVTCAGDVTVGAVSQSLK